jgi:MoaA/NifB/PqqE/SkfB family radical SAM enzyme
MDMGAIDRLFDELGGRDDSLIVFGGFGEPLLHPEFDEIVRRARRAGVFGLAMRTNGLALDAARIDAILAARVDVVVVLLDAHSPELYREVHRFDGYEQAVANMNALLDARAARKCPQPLVVPEMVKTRRTIGQMEAFYDDWIRKTGCAAIVGAEIPPGLADAFPDPAIMDMSPPKRFPCVRLWSRLVVLADGTVTICTQDVRGEQAIGRLGESSVGELWTGNRMNDLRRAHRSDEYGLMPLCPPCRQWHRP